MNACQILFTQRPVRPQKLGEAFLSACAEEKASGVLEKHWFGIGILLWSSISFRYSIAGIHKPVN